MKTPAPTTWRHRGVAAVEFALALPVMLILLVLPLYLGWYLYHQTVAQTATQHAARYLSKIPLSEMTNPYRAATVAAVANQIAAEMLAELRPGGIAPSISAACDNVPCVGANKPTTVSVSIQITVEDIFYPDPSRSHSISVTTKLPYLGR